MITRWILSGWFAVSLASANTAILPAPNTEKDGYDWQQRHRQAIETARRVRPDVVLIGDSITHYWSGEPKAAHVRGPESWRSLFEGLRPLNLGFGWDRTQNVLWRIDHGELDGIEPSTVIVHIGTNNTSASASAPANSPQEIADGVLAVCDRVRQKLPKARILLMAIFPREQQPEHPRRAAIDAANRILAQRAPASGLFFIDLAPRLLATDGTLPRTLMPDFCHPSEDGYRVWAEALRPYLHPVAWPDPRTAAGRGGFNTAWQGFRATWERRQADFMKSRESDRGAVVFLGDSITQSAPLKQLFPQFPAANRGISGDTSRGMLHRLEDNVLSLDPRAVVILAGTNDLFQPGNSPENTAANLAAMCRAIHARHPSIPVIVCRIMPHGKPDGRDARTFNRAIERVIPSMPGVTLVDLHSPFLKNGAYDTALLEDGVHPNAAGYRVFRDSLTPVFEKVLPAGEKK